MADQLLVPLMKPLWNELYSWREIEFLIWFAQREGESFTIDGVSNMWLRGQNGPKGALSLLQDISN